MNKNRLISLQEMLKDEPNDPFLNYAIALEFSKTDVNQAIIYFEKLLQSHPDYIGTYYQFGKLLQDLNQNDKAESIFKIGIVVATEKPNFHALAELRTAYNKLLGLDYEND